MSLSPSPKLLKVDGICFSASPFFPFALVLNAIGSRPSPSLPPMFCLGQAPSSLLIPTGPLLFLQVLSRWHPSPMLFPLSQSGTSFASFPPPPSAPGTDSIADPSFIFPHSVFFISFICRHPSFYASYPARAVGNVTPLPPLLADAFLLALNCVNVDTEFVQTDLVELLVLFLYLHPSSQAILLCVQSLTSFGCRFLRTSERWTRSPLCRASFDSIYWRVLRSPPARIRKRSVVEISFSEFLISVRPFCIPSELLLTPFLDFGRVFDVPQLPLDPALSFRLFFFSRIGPQ